MLKYITSRGLGVGNKQINICKTEFEEYLTDESRMSGSASKVAFPEDVEELSAYMAAEHSQGNVVTAQGSRTGLNGGAVPFGGSVVNLEKSNRVLGMRCDEEADSYMLHIQPGITLDALTELIRTKMFEDGNWDAESRAAYARFQKDGVYFFPPDPTERTASLGGMISCNASGACSYYYGSIRGYVQAVTVVLSDGEVVEIARDRYIAKGRKFDVVLNGKEYRFELPGYNFWDRKNATCYYAKDGMDLVDLFIGAEGTLGVIAGAWIKLTRKPTYCWGVLSFFDSYEGLKKFLQYIRDVKQKKEAYVAALEFFDSNALQIIKDNAYGMDQYEGIPALAEDYKAALYYELHAEDEEEAAVLLEQTFEKLMEYSPYADEAVAAMDDAELDRLKKFRHAAPECANIVIDRFREKEKSLTAIFTDIATKEEDFFDMLELYEETMKQAGIRYIVYGHIGDWHLHVNMLPSSREEYERCMGFYDMWARRAAEKGGTISAEHGVGRLKANMLKYMVLPQDIEKCRNIKEIFNQGGLLNKGVIFN